jgi:hypothetical protein
MALDRKLAPRRRLEAVHVPGRNSFGFQWFQAVVMAGSQEKWRFGPFKKAPFSANFGPAHTDSRRAFFAGLSVPSANVRQSGADCTVRFARTWLLRDAQFDGVRAAPGPEKWYPGLARR